MASSDRTAIPDDGTRLARWRADMDAWAQANIVGQPVSKTLHEILRSTGEVKLRKLGIAGHVTIEDWYGCTHCDYEQPEEGVCPRHGFKLDSGTIPHLVVDLDDAWKLESPRQWRMRPFLPMKRYNDDPSVDKIYGTVVEGLGPQVFLVQVYEMGAFPREVLERGALIPPAGPKIPTMTYETVAQMLGDGWLVD